MTAPRSFFESSPPSPPPPPRWVAFDAVGTLICPDPPVRQIYADVAVRHGSRLTADEIGLRFRVAYQRLEEQSPSLQTSEALEVERWRDIVAEVLPDVAAPHDCFRDLFEWFASPRAWRVYADVAPALARLADCRIPAAIASNFDHRLHPVCNGLPELSNLTVRVISSEVGFRKPAAEFYEALQRQTGVDAAQIAMIGDSHRNDVEGARLSGLRALWIDRDRPAAGDRVQTLVQAVDRLTASIKAPGDGPTTG